MTNEVKKFKLMIAPAPGQGLKIKNKNNQTIPILPLTLHEKCTITGLELTNFANLI